MAQRIQLRRGTAAEWTAANPVLAVGEPGVETDTGKQKFGNGTSAWTALPYASKGDQGIPGVADDASVKTLINNPASQTAGALSATYAPRWKANTAYAAGVAVLSPAGDIVTAKTGFTSGASYDAANWNLSPGVTANIPVDGGQTLAAKIGMLAGPATVALLGDSTGNDDTEWFRTMLNSLGTSNPKVGIDYRVWNDTSKTYPAPTTIQAGTQDGMVVKDTFTRTGALIGSLPDTGPAWYGDAGADAQYTMSGSALTFTGTTLAGYFAYPGGDGKQKVSTNFTFSAAGASTTLRLYGLYKDANNYVAIFITFGASQITWTITKKIAGTFGTVATGTANPFAYTGATFAASITVNGTAVTAVVNGVTLNGTLLAGDVTALATTTPAGGISFNVVGGSADDFQIDRVGTTAAMQLSAYNGSVPGTGTAEALVNLDLGILPVAPDLVFISFSHNHGADTGAVFAGKLMDVVTKVRSKWPNAGIAISSQNPRITPAANITDHAARNVAARALAKQRNWGYVPAFERFMVQPNLYVLINTTDGVHPVTAGSLVWRDAALSYLNLMKPDALVPGNPTLSVTYNDDGSVASTSENGVLTTFTYNTDGTVNTQTRAGVTKTFSYDANGNVTGAA